MTTFIDFRYSRALAAALFTGQEKEEATVEFPAGCDTSVALDIGGPGTARRLAVLVGGGGVAATLAVTERGAVSLSDAQGRPLVTTAGPVASGILGLRLGPSVCGLKADGVVNESAAGLFSRTASVLSETLGLECVEPTRVMGQGSGRATRWGELFYHRGRPSGLSLELTLDWHHLRAGIPLFGTMTAEELVSRGDFRLGFRSYAYEASDAEMTDFVRLFASGDPPDIAVHLTPALYDLRRSQVPNVGFSVVETDRVHPHLVERSNHMDRVIVPTRFVRAVLQRAGVSRPIEVVPHGVDTGHFRPAAARQPLPGGRRFNFLAVATHVERKNIAHLVRAFLEEFREREDVALFLLLRPEYHTTQNNVALEFTEWERRWARASAPIYLWTGYITRDHLRDFYANADAYVMPSNEGFGLTLLEAMASGTPVIGLGHGGVLDFVSGENGILVPPGRPFVALNIDTLPYVGETFYAPSLPGLRAAMRRLFENPDLCRRLGARGRADAERQNWPVVTGAFARTVERTHAEFHARSSRTSARASSPGVGSPSGAVLTFVLCVVDDEDARASLDGLRALAGHHVRALCLFTRYARLKDVLRARRHGFVSYRWDGTVDNARRIARNISAAQWVGVLHVNERLAGDLSALVAFLAGQPFEVGEVAVEGPSGALEPRFLHARIQGAPAGMAEYRGVAVQRFAR